MYMAWLVPLPPPVELKSLGHEWCTINCIIKVVCHPSTMDGITGIKISGLLAQQSRDQCPANQNKESIRSS